MKFPPFLHSHLRLTLLGTPPNRVFFTDRFRIGSLDDQIKCRKIGSLIFKGGGQAGTECWGGTD